MMNPFLQVAIGGAFGSVARYAVSRIMPLHGPGFPVATLAVNVSGCLAMGLLAALLAHRAAPWAPLLLTGILGGYTTFSAFSLETLALWERGQVFGAGLYVAGTVLLSLLAVVAGLFIGRGIWA